MISVYEWNVRTFLLVFSHETVIRIKHAVNSSLFCFVYKVIIVIIFSRFQASCRRYAPTNNSVACLAETRTSAYVDLRLYVLSRLSRSWQLARRSVATFVGIYPRYDAVTCGNPAVTCAKQAVNSSLFRCVYRPFIKC